ncbi:MAG: single-stranded DNA-binding protein [Dysgonomonas sp.]|jgi:single-strand DNA-binding protein|uniref:single-stranded DNA-binding protein n=1 Tax=unclassified Dysgonomonas TaxID=2630389 RepID=UPI0025BF634A|nr:MULTISPECIES: single-stranded DNA-binding protein [unclassified Dysgonomonas]MDR1715663.1 single-stranded DNA-binding protein [Prevotella sp.]MDR2002258.1 single-stranded DNA-binding protein [Prevotella sp.]HMM03330.1 single-stranded DNA-binding protein [Dysgonomonas sp.]
MSVNKVILIGNVGKDPDVKYFDNGSVVANFTLATTERGYTAANGTQIPDRTEWHNIVCWRGLAKVAEQFVKKGTQVYVEGKIRSRTYDDANGMKRYVNEIYADNLELLGSRRREGGDANENMPYSQPANETYQSPNSYNSSNNISEEDDLPF